MTAKTDRTFAKALERRLPGLSAPERRAEFLGLLQEHLPEGSDAILVGGALVELLTEGQYVTGDVDLIGDPDAIGGLLEDAGFERTGRHLVHEELGLTVEIVAPQLEANRRSERIRWRDHTLRVLSVEDLIIDRLCAAKFWGSARDHEQAHLIYGTHHDRLDEDRLAARADEERVRDLLDELEAGARG